MCFARYARFLFLILPCGLFSQAQDQDLQNRIGELVAGFHGRVGIYVTNIRTGETASVNADSLFPTASMIKVPILLAVMNAIEKRQLEYHQSLIYRDSLSKKHEDESDILASFKDKEKIELSKLIMLMLTVSDNTASIWLQDLVGGGSAINAELEMIGLSRTRVNSRTPARESAQKKYGWGQTTPREMATLFEKLYRGTVISRSASFRMLRLLGRNYWDEEGIGQLPVNVFVADKVGAVDASRSETMLVEAPHGAYILSVITADQKDISWNPDNEGWVLERKLSRLVWDHFEPDSNWEPIVDFRGKWMK